MKDFGQGSQKPKYNPRDPFSKGERAVWMRNNPTPGESSLIDILVREQIHFRFQQIVLGFIPDFLILKKRLLLEVDGGIHEETEQAEYDAGRDEIFRRAGWRVIHLTNYQVLNQDELCVQIIRGAMDMPRLKMPKNRTRRDHIRALGRRLK